MINIIEIGFFVKGMLLTLVRMLRMMLLMVLLARVLVLVLLVVMLEMLLMLNFCLFDILVDLGLIRVGDQIVFGFILSICNLKS